MIEQINKFNVNMQKQHQHFGILFRKPSSGYNTTNTFKIKHTLCKAKS